MPSLQGGGHGVMWRAYTGVVNTQCTWPDSESTKLLYHTKQDRGGQGASDTCRPAPLLVNF